jgi:hypothetical protein
MGWNWPRFDLHGQQYHRNQCRGNPNCPYADHCFSYADGQYSSSSNGGRIDANSANRSESNSNRSYYLGVAINCNCHETPAAKRYCVFTANRNRHRDTDCGANSTR